MPLPATLFLTPKEREVIWHRLGEGLIPECLSDDPDTTIAESEAARQRLETAEDSLKLRFADKWFIDVATEDEMNLVVDAFEGSAFWANVQYESPQQRSAADRVCRALRLKLEQAFGFSVEAPGDM